MLKRQLLLLLMDQQFNPRCVHVEELRWCPRCHGGSLLCLDYCQVLDGNAFRDDGLKLLRWCGFVGNNNWSRKVIDSLMFMEERDCFVH